MIYLIIVILVALSFILALLSLRKQNKVEELKGIKKELKRKKIIFRKDS